MKHWKEFMRVAFVSTLFIVFQTNLAFTQPIPKIDSNVISNPKIGLVLSGGGALGLAHIGVLKILEKKGIKPDFIVGTSMGSIVGGLYALGYSASEIEHFALQTDWNEVLAPNIPLNYVALEEKHDYGRYLISFPLKDGKPQLPSGLIEGQLLIEKLISYTWSAINYSHFDEFPIPFRCIGTNVSNGKEIIFEGGSLALSMRASMAIPTVFTPVNLDSTLIVDGGVVNNFPVDVAIDMGADYIIGVDVTSGFHDAYDIDNMVSILYQISMFPSLNKMAENIKRSNIYIHPDVTDFSAKDFKKVEDIIKSGEEMAQIQSSQIDSLIHSIHYYSQPVVRQVAPYSDSIYVSNTSYRSSQKNSDYHLIEKLNTDSNVILNTAEFRKDIRLLYGSLKYKSISYWASPDTHTFDTSSGMKPYQVNIQMEENPNTSLKFGIHYDNTFGFGVITNLTAYNFLMKNSRIRLITDLSENYKAEIEWLKYIGKKQNSSLSTNYKFYSLEQPTYNKGQLSGFQQNNISQFEAKLQTHKYINQNISGGYMYLFDGTTAKLGNDEFQNFKTRNGYHIAFVQYQNNTLNRNYHPTRGFNLNLRIDLNLTNDLRIKYPNDVNLISIPIDTDTLHLTEHEFNQFIKNELIPQRPYASAVVEWQQIIPIHPKLNAITYAGGAFTLGQKNNDKLYRAFNVGGNIKYFYYDFRAYGLRYAEDIANNIGILRADLQYSPVDKLFIYGGTNLVLFSNSGFRINSFASDLSTFTANELVGYGLNVAYMSPIGPLEIGASWNSLEPYTRWTVLMGFQF